MEQEQFVGFDVSQAETSVCVVEVLLQRLVVVAGHLREGIGPLLKR